MSSRRLTSRGHRTTEIPGFTRTIHAVTYRDPADPPATTALIRAIQDSVG